MTKNDIGTIILNWLKGFFTKNLALKIVSLLFAMLIWGYVMVEVNPKRVKTITDVPVSFSGESSLHDRGLAVRGDRDDILRNVTVRVKVQLTDYTGLDASDISASVSLRPVNKADTYKLKIDATSSLGTVENVSPSEITIEVDELATMLVPIDVEYSGELPEGYWKSEPTLASQSIKVSGPRDDVSTISKAICTINLEDRTTSYNEAILLKYVDKNGDEIELKDDEDEDTPVCSADTKQNYVVDDDSTINAEGYAIEDENGEAIVSTIEEFAADTEYSDTGMETSEDDF